MGTLLLKMESISGLSGSQPEVEATAVETNTSQSQQLLPPPVPKKRKVVETRSPVWDHFDKIKDSEGIVIKGKCLYCARVYCCESKKHGTSSLRHHVVNCLKNPHSKDTRQSLLTFQPAPSFAETESSEGYEGVLGLKSLQDGLSVGTFLRFFSDERLNLKKFFRTSSQRVSITTDTWTSIQRINYMCITAHFIDSEWKLQKKIISFVPIYSHKGESIAKALEICLMDWGLKSVFSVTVDNASSNDTALGFLKKKFVSWGCTAVRSKYLHMRCIAHILNLVVQDGWKESDSAVQKVRDVVRCNSTYMMLSAALLYDKVFEEYASSDSGFKFDLGENMPNFMDWETISGLVKILKSFYEMTIRISGSLNMVEADGSVKLMGTNMRAKFDKYWGEHEKMNFLIFYANILDPRDKIEYMPIQFTHLYGEDKGKTMFDKVVVGLKELFQDYVSCFPVQSIPENSAKSAPSVIIFYCVSVGKPQVLLKSHIKKQKLGSGDLSMKKTELEVYLSEVIVDDEDSFDLLRWWKLNSDRFPVLSKMARDDWLRLSNQPISVEENIEDVERIEKELCSTSTTGVGSLPTIPCYSVCVSNINVPQTLIPWLGNGKCSMAW
ncbi:PREDICTED: zinc finger BED domain-containing protein RICESLEEPER 2-like [Ipomoea nil]|uniref:zinc finger BED domain-containing protein RICESLEEPER 2-like n=1 Tax=Ipomoea nil TaxID=35883 RepID=UPI000900855F|nr:PREDICTED: zinc finger BED domain-containing protein RICESLEEPER 2-like [Ipomoea nil]